MVVVLAHDLDDQVEGARRDDHVVDLGNLGQRVRDRVDVALHVDADQRLPLEPNLERISYRDDLDHAGVHESLDALAHGRLGHPDRLGNRRVGPAAVLL